MEKVLFPAAMIAFTLIMACCSQNNGDNPDPAAITLVKTLPGGCNNMTSEGLKSAYPEEPDTVIFSRRKDTLVMFSGINYLCCAPFGTESTVRNDSLLIKLEDRCNFPQENCYCKCMCYYTWEFLFTGFQQGKVKGYRVTLDDPRQKEPAVILEGGLVL